LEICACIVGTSQFAVSEDNKKEIPVYSPEQMTKEFEILLAKMTAMTQEHFRADPFFPP
jgi:hypothetical protein